MTKTIKLLHVGYAHQIVELVTNLPLSDSEAIKAADNAGAPYGGSVEGKWLQPDGTHKFRVKVYTD